MDPATLASTAAGLVAKQALEAAGDQAGTTGWQALGHIAQTIRGGFAGDQEATETLDRLEAKPESPARTADLAEVLAPRLEADPGLVAELGRLVEQAKADPQTASFVTAVRDNARVGRITTIGGNPLLAALMQRYQEDETILWQGPALALAAQAFLLTIGLGKDTTSAGRIISTSLALVTTLTSIYLVLRKRQELDDILSRIDRRWPDVAKAFGDTHSRLGVSPMWRGKGLQWRSTEAWLVVLGLFGIGDLLVFAAMLTGWLYK